VSSAPSALCDTKYNAMVVRTAIAITVSQMNSPVSPSPSGGTNRK